MEPRSFDVVVVGGGPGGAAAASFCGRAGLQTLLFDKEHFPRDKVCGDAVCFGSIRVLRELGLEEAVDQAVSCRASGVAVINPKGDVLDLPFVRRADGSRDLVSVPVYGIARKVFDDVLFQHAKREPGVTALERMTFLDFTYEAGRIKGVAVQDERGDRQEIEAPIVIGADGALSTVAEKAGAYDFRQRNPAHWMGSLRAYYEGVRGLDQRMELHFFEELLPGYLWIFPVGEGRANVGAGAVETALTGRSGRERVNLRQTFHALLNAHPRLRGRFAEAREVPGSLRGWQIPCGSERRRLAGDGWMLIGDAASLVDPFSGEGIANALVSAKLAAEQAVEAHRAPRSGALRRYEERVWREMGNGLLASHRLQRAARYRPLVDFVIGRAANRPRVKEAIVELFAEPETLGQLTHFAYLWKLLFL